MLLSCLDMVSAGPWDAHCVWAGMLGSRLCRGKRTRGKFGKRTRGKFLEASILDFATMLTALCDSGHPGATF